MSTGQLFSCISFIPKNKTSLLRFSVGPAVTSLSEWDEAHWPVQPFWFAAFCVAHCVWKQSCSLLPQGSSSLISCKLSDPRVLVAAASQRSSNLFDHVASWMPFITLQPLNHGCAFGKMKEGGAGSLCDWIGGAVAKGRASTIDDRYDGAHAYKAAHLIFHLDSTQTHCPKAAEIHDWSHLNPKLFSGVKDHGV